jgi:hypothetical protein
MADPYAGQDPTASEASARRLPPGPRAWSYAIVMALWVAVLSLLTGCFVIFVLLLDARARRWEGPAVFGIGLFIVLFLAWAIYSTVRTESAPQPRILDGPPDAAGSGDGGPEGASLQ